MTNYDYLVTREICAMIVVIILLIGTYKLILKYNPPPK